jgi:hypothetical protein
MTRSLCRFIAVPHGDQYLQTCTVCGAEYTTTTQRAFAVCRVASQDPQQKPGSDKSLAEEISHGPGTELHAILGRFGLTASGDCKCNSRATYMDRMEAEQPGWCEANIEEIVGWLRESAAERGLPFLDVAARLLVKRAIHNARKAEAKRASEEASQAAAEGRPA